MMPLSFLEKLLPLAVFAEGGFFLKQKTRISENSYHRVNLFARYICGNMGRTL